MTNKQVQSGNHNVAMVMEFLRYGSGVSVVYYLFEPFLHNYIYILWAFIALISLLGFALLISSWKNEHNEDSNPKIKEFCFWVRPVLNLIRNYSPFLAIVLLLEKVNLIQYITNSINITERVALSLLVTFSILMFCSILPIRVFIFDIQKERPNVQLGKKSRIFIVFIVMIFTMGLLSLAQNKIQNSKIPCRTKCQPTEVTNIPKQQPISVPTTQVEQPKLTHNFKKTATTTSKHKKFIKKRKRCRA